MHETSQPGIDGLLPARADRLFTAHAIPFGILLIEPEQWPLFQAAHGQEAVRAILRVVGHTLRTRFGRTDYVGRWKAISSWPFYRGAASQFLESEPVGLKVTGQDGSSPPLNSRSRWTVPFNRRVTLSRIDCRTR